MDSDDSLADIKPKQLKNRYDDRTNEVSVDSHRNEIGELKTFWKWSMKKGYVIRSPAESIEPQGRRKKGKPQLRRSEARLFFDKAFSLAQRGDEGALAVMSILIMGLRSSEILDRCVRDVDVDEDGVLLWIDEGKTSSARRYHEVPEPVASLLAAQVANRGPKEWLFPANTQTGHRRLEWPRDVTHKICESIGLPLVTPQGLRGTWATLIREAGVSSHILARELGHADDRVTKQHYLATGSDDRARTRKMLRVIAGGSRELGMK